MLIALSKIQLKVQGDYHDSFFNKPDFSFSCC